VARAAPSLKAACEAGTERSFYPYFFSPREEQGIINRLRRIDEHQVS
jgi:hypothetical protein